MVGSCDPLFRVCGIKDKSTNSWTSVCHLANRLASFLLGGPTFGLLLAAGHGGWFGAAFFCGGTLLLGSFALLIVGGYWYEDDEISTGDTSTMSDEATMVHCRAVSNERVCPKKVMDGAV